MNTGKFSWKARGRSFRYAVAGIKSLISGEHNAWIHCVVAIAVIAAGAVLGLKPMEWAIISICIGGVFMAEGFNSAIEALADKTCRQPDPLIKRAKDLAAGSVLLFVAGAVAAGLIIFTPKLIALL